MYTFLIRLGDKDIGECKTTKELIKEFDKVLDTFYKTGKGDNDIKYLSICKDKMHLVLKHRNDLFANNLRKNYMNCNLNTLHNNGGIYRLCSFSSPDKTLNDKLRNLHQTWLKKETKSDSKRGKK